ncbi:uncharacterized protein [Apostichopus japonicus]|uniref:uncharacterized protein n=1 Tax=Stichopus japonicus TaxID=307972 RepID=UPI003AB6055B
MENALNEMEQYSRRNCLRFMGVAETKDEDTNAVIKPLAATKLGVTIRDEDLDRSHRIGKLNQDGKPRIIIAKFTRHDVRDQVIRSRRKLKGMKMAIQEDLTAGNLDLLKKVEKHQRVEAVWTVDGRIMAIVNNGQSESKMRIRSLGDLRKI